MSIEQHLPPCPSRECAATGCDCMLEPHHSFDWTCRDCGKNLDTEPAWIDHKTERRCYDCDATRYGGTP